MLKKYETRTESTKEMVYISSLFATYNEFIVDFAIVYAENVYDIDVSVDASTAEGLHAWEHILEAMAIIEDYVAD